MAINPSTEVLLSLTEAARTLPRRRAGKRPHVSTLYRWSTVGCKGVILESIQIGCTRCTSREALSRFFEALTYAGSSTTHQTPRQRQRATAAAESELIREGV